MYKQIFQSIGFTPELQSIYLSLLENGRQTASQIAKSTAVQRTYIYNLADQLIEKGLIRKELEGKTTLFAAFPPEKLLDLARQRKYESEQTELLVEKVLPELKKKFAAGYGHSDDVRDSDGAITITMRVNGEEVTVSVNDPDFSKGLQLLLKSKLQ